MMVSDLLDLELPANPLRVPLITSMINNATAFRDQLQQCPRRYQTVGKEIESNRDRLQWNSLVRQR